MGVPGSQNATHTLPRLLASGRWIHEDGELVVASRVANPGLHSLLAGESAPSFESPFFTVYTLDGVVMVLHRLKPAEIDNDLAELVAGELVRSRYVTVPRAFERCFAGVVLSSAPDFREAWRGFYDNTLSRLQKVTSGPCPDRDSGPVAVFGRIYEHARKLVVGSSLLDVGTCFGFFPLLLKRSDPKIDTIALDVSVPILELARVASTSSHHAGDIRFLCGDACNLPFAGQSCDTVTALHLLEHLSDSSAKKALQEMCRVARHRAIVAVPLEEEPDPAYGHVQSFDRERLVYLGNTTGWRCHFEDYLGGWIVLEPDA